MNPAETETLSFCIYQVKYPSLIISFCKESLLCFSLHISCPAFIDPKMQKRKITEIFLE